MRKRYKSIQLLLTFFVLSIFTCSTSLTKAETIQVGEQDKNSLNVTENTYSVLKVENKLAFFNSLDVTTDRGEFTKLVIQDYSKNNEFGTPELPVHNKLIEVPFGAELSVEIVNYTMEEYKLSELGIDNPIFPAQPPASKSIDEHKFIYNASAYEKDMFYPQKRTSLDYLGVMRGLRIARLGIAPIQYNPVTQTIRVYTDVEVKVNFKNANVLRTIEEKKAVAGPYYNAVSRRLINYKPLEGKELITDAPVKYVIISDPQFENQLQPFIEWKTRKGFNVIEAYTDDPNVGNTTSSIKAYLQDLYENTPPDEPKPSFVLFVGDVEEIPAWSGNTGSHVTDLFYCEYTDDLFPEVYYGRFSASNAGELQPYIDKTLQYEQYTMPDPSYLDEVVLVAGMDSGHGNDWGNGHINYGTENYFNAAHGIDAHVYLYPNSGGQSAEIIQNISDGVSYGNYTAHCSSSGWADPSFTTSDISSLQNQDKYSLLVGNCCTSSAFDSECFGEEIVRAENKGALGYIGGSNSTYWDEDYYFGVGFGEISENPPPYEETGLGMFDVTFHDHGEPIEDWYVTQGQMFVGGNLAVTESGSSREEYYWEIYCLMGDPSLMVYFSQPPQMAVDYQQLMPLGTSTFEVTTEPYAYVAISKDGVLHGAAIADESGYVEVPLDPITVPGMAEVIVTKQNGEPYLGEVTVASPDGPYVLVNEYTIDDASGNGNGQADYNEELLLDVTLENVGNDDAFGVVAELSTTDEYVTITDATENWPDIPSGELSLVEGAFGVTVDELVPDGHNLQFLVTISDENDSIWTSNITMTLYAPVLEAGGMSVDDVDGGNGNGRLDPGETANLLIETYNTGSSDAFEAMSTLASTNEYITLNSTSFEPGTIPAGDFVLSEFNVTVDDEAPVGTTIDFDFELNAGAYSVAKTYYSTIGIIDEDFETGDFSQYNWGFEGADWTIDSSDPYEGEYSAKSGTINHGQQSVMSISFHVVAEGELSFFRKVSSESGYDYLRFYVDGMEMGSWSGEVSWGEETYTISEGMHTFKWVYDKDGSVSNGSDCGWVDMIIFPPINTNAILEVGGMSVDDSQNGNGNGRLDPGEEPTLIIDAMNSGLSIAPDVMAELTTTSEYITINSGSYEVGDLVPGASEDAIFEITVDENTPMGTLVELTCMLTSGSITAEKTFTRLIDDLIIEDFETGDFSMFDWTFGGDADWEVIQGVAYEGQYAAQSGNVDDQQSSELSLTMNVASADSLTFYRKVSSEDSYDYLRFYIDGTMMDEWSGELDWEHITYVVEPGEHTFTWSYEKDYSISSGSDCGWIDYIRFPGGTPPEPVVADFAADMTEIFTGETINFTDLSTGNPTSWEWTFEGGEPATSTEQNPTVVYNTAGTFDVSLTVSNGGSTDTKVMEDYITVTEYESHFGFIPGNPADPVYTLYLSGATLDNESLVAYDEIGIFRDDVLVGAFTLDTVLTPENQFDHALIAFSTLFDGSTGYIPGEPMTFKAWDASAEEEIDMFDVTFFDPYGDAWTQDVYPAEDGEYSLIDLAFTGSGMQMMNLATGYQFVSTHMEPIDPDMMVLCDELMYDETLDFIRDSEGSMMQKIGPNWVNNIGDWNTMEGYLFKMLGDDQLMMEGTAMDPQTPMPLETGYKFISYLPYEAMDAVEAMGTVLDNMDFLRNSAGEMVQMIGPNWVNNIGNMVPGEGYLIKMNASDELIYPEAGPMDQTTQHIKASHFKFQGGNPADPVYTIYVSPNDIIQPGDEVAVFDGETLVGSTVITSEDPLDNDIPVFSTLTNEKGYTAGSDITLKVWNMQSKAESSLSYSMLNPYGDAHTLKTFPAADGVYSILELKAGNTGLDENGGLATNFLGNNYPNPFNNTTIIEYGVASEKHISISIYNAFGQKIRTLVDKTCSAGKYTVEFNGSDLEPGIYQYRMTISDDQNHMVNTKKMIIAR